MTTRDTPFPPGTPCWIDLFTSEPARSKEFYRSLFGWEFIDRGEQFGGYVMVTSAGYEVAGMMQNTPDSGSPDVWSTYLASDDIDASVAQATGAAATVLAPVMPVGELGSMAVLIDPAGAAVGLWQAGDHIGFRKYDEHGSIAWSEVHSKDFAASVDFYRKLCGWSYDITSDTDDFRYYTAQVGGRPVAGVMDSAAYLPPEVPSHWAVYFSVDDVDTAVVQAKAGGATVLRPPEDTPFGRVADLVDPTGAPFKLHAALRARPSSGSDATSETDGSEPVDSTAASPQRDA
jgi:predicted enzyme related to lactoylglutathione lyase